MLRMYVPTHKLSFKKVRQGKKSGMTASSAAEEEAMRKSKVVEERACDSVRVRVFGVCVLNWVEVTCEDVNYS